MALFVFRMHVRYVLIIPYTVIVLESFFLYFAVWHALSGDFVKNVDFYAKKSFCKLYTVIVQVFYFVLKLSFKLVLYPFSCLITRRPRGYSILSAKISAKASTHPGTWKTFTCNSKMGSNFASKYLPKWTGICSA